MGKSENEIKMDEKEEGTSQNENVQELAPGWIELYNDEGTPYYYHAENQTTSWVKPGRNKDNVNESRQETETPSVGEELLNETQGENYEQQEGKVVDELAPG